MPYISPSEQAILDAEAAERERLRLLMLADDFRERALMAMMNGVLEVRWEDELRKDVPRPKCLVNNNNNLLTIKIITCFSWKKNLKNSTKKIYELFAITKLKLKF